MATAVLDSNRKRRLIEQIKASPYLAITCTECRAEVGSPCKAGNVDLLRPHRVRLLDVAHEIEMLTKTRVILQAIDYLKIIG